MEISKNSKGAADLEFLEDTETISNLNQKPPFFDANSAKKIPRTLREQYLLEKERIKYEVGDLEQIRISLGYSQRRMCQLLLVDPSAWTRWTKTLTGAPPHVYQALKWLVELKKSNPDAVAPSNIARRMDFVENSTQGKIKELRSEIKTLERIVAQQSGANWEQAFAALQMQIQALAMKQPVKKASKKSKKKPKRKPKKKAVVKSKKKTAKKLKIKKKKKR